MSRTQKKIATEHCICKVSVIIALLMFLSSSSFAEEKDSNQRISIYMHPTSILLFTYASAISQGVNFYLEFTGEVPLGKYTSIVVVPSVFNTSDEWIVGWKAFRVGSGIGIRFFPNGKTEGFYFQFMPGVYYVERNNNAGIYADALAYAGYSFKFSKFSMFLDIGWGLGLPKFLRVLEEDFKVDINFGIGIPL